MTSEGKRFEGWPVLANYLLLYCEFGNSRRSWDLFLKVLFPVTSIFVGRVGVGVLRRWGEGFQGEI